MRRRALTLVELLVFAALIVIASAIAWDIASGSGRLLGSARRTAASQLELQDLLETLARDVEELTYIQSKAPLDGVGTFSFAVLSAHYEAGLPVPTRPVPRGIEYSVRQSGERMAIDRKVFDLGPSGRLEDRVATSPVRTLARSLEGLSLSPLVWAPRPPSGYQIAPADHSLAQVEGAQAAAVMATVKLAEPGVKPIEGEPPVAVTVRLWCRRRLAQLSREGTP